MGNQGKVAAVIVTHNSSRVLPLCVAALQEQAHGVSEIIIVDCGSADRSYLEHYLVNSQINIIFEENIGFARGNNVGVERVSANIEFVLFLNPDTFLGKNFIAHALAIMADHNEIGVLTGKMASYDLVRKSPNGRLIFRKWYGRWYDRGHGEEDRGLYDRGQNVPAICGALMFCRRAVLNKVAPEGEIFDPAFFMYKEDIELSLRFRASGVRLFYFPYLSAFHCRGWDKDRRKVSSQARLLSARNEVLLYRRHPSLYIAWALLKYFLVRFFHI